MLGHAIVGNIAAAFPNTHHVSTVVSTKPASFRLKLFIIEISSSESRNNNEIILFQLLDIRVLLFARRNLIPIRGAGHSPPDYEWISPKI